MSLRIETSFISIVYACGISRSEQSRSEFGILSHALSRQNRFLQARVEFVFSSRKPGQARGDTSASRRDLSNNAGSESIIRLECRCIVGYCQAILPLLSLEAKRCCLKGCSGIAIRSDDILADSVIDRGLDRQPPGARCLSSGPLVTDHLGRSHIEADGIHNRPGRRKHFRCTLA